MPKDKFMFFPNFKAMADKLDDGMRLKFYDSLTNYVFCGQEPQDPIISALLEAIKPSLDKVDGRQNNGGNHNPNGVNQHTKVGQSGQIRSKLVNSGQFLSETETETEEETEIKEKEISDDISKKKFTADSEIDVNGQDFNEFPAECMPLLREYWTDEKIESIRKDLAAMYPHKTTVRRLLEKYPENKSKPKQSRFVKPTLEEVEAYCEERQNGIDAVAFYSFYESKGWQIGKNQMRNWKAAIITWERKNYEKPLKQQII